MKKSKVLFLCTGNSARSQIAEAFLRKYAGDRFEVYSAGLNPQGINPYTVRVLEERGVNIDEHTSDPVKKYMGRIDFRYVITVCAHADAHCPTPLWHHGTKLHWPFDDPAAATGTDEEIMASFRAVRDQIEAKIKAWVGEFETA